MSPKRPSADPPLTLDDLTINEDHYEAGIRVLLRPTQEIDGVEIGVDVPEASRRSLSLKPSAINSPQAAQKSVQVLAIIQTPTDIKFSLEATRTGRDSNTCDIYYDPGGDNVILRNTSQVSIAVEQLRRSPTHYQIEPRGTLTLSSSSWKLDLGDKALLELKVLPRRPPSFANQRPVQIGGLTESSRAGKSTGKLKRTHNASQDTVTTDAGAPAVQRRKISHSKGNEIGIAFKLADNVDLQARINQNPPNPSKSSSNGHPLTLEQGQTIYCPGSGHLRSYTVTRSRLIASVELSEVYLAQHSSFDKPLVVKVSKPRRSCSEKAVERSVISRAESWAQEYSIQRQFEHSSIVRLLDADSRFLTLFLEFIPGADLARLATWRGSDDTFLGSEDDAYQIWRDIGNGLTYIHGQGIQHNDIKPANIIFSRERGAVLCDFGLSSFAASQSKNVGGTPFYLPIEFLREGKRGIAGDIWAFGVTMLYVLNFIPLPDARGRNDHPRRLYWQISEIIDRPGSDKGKGSTADAKKHMASWIKELLEVQRNLNEADECTLILRDMLDPQPSHRIDAAELVKRLAIRQTRMATRSSGPQREGSDVIQEKSVKEDLDQSSATEEDSSA